jgi:hypothetical protein
MRDFLAEPVPFREDEPMPRHEPAAVPVDLRQRAKPVVFHLEDPVGVIERVGNAHERHRPACREHGKASSVAVPTAEVERSFSSTWLRVGGGSVGTAGGLGSRCARSSSPATHTIGQIFNRSPGLDAAAGNPQSEINLKSEL